jgi:leucyl-tRNA synthetase
MQGNKQEYIFSAIEAKWQKTWEQKNIFLTKIDQTKKKYYVLSMFPYPSGKLHIGHVRNYSLGDVIARFKTMQGYNTLHPMGWDAFGLPAENAAIERQIAPKKWTYDNIEYMKRQIKSFGISYDWTKELATCDPNYYVYEQKFFLKLLKAGLAYKKVGIVNWDPVENTVLANEQVVDGKGWRSGAEVQKKELNQWFLKITAYQDKLLQDLDKLKDWPQNVVSAQRSWIGKSNGVVINFDIILNQKKVGIIEAYTSTPELLFGVEFLSISDLNPFIKPFLSNDTDVKGMQNVHNKYDVTEGIKLTLQAVNPVNLKQIPIFINNLVDRVEYASLGFPGHEKNDTIFAKNWDIAFFPIVDIGGNKMINSDFLSGLQVREAKEKIIEYLENNNLGYKKTVYRLNDWGISRQRFWGCPIPIIYCDKCGMLPVLETDLPVILPKSVSGLQVGNYLDQHPTWKYTTCYKCHGNATREVDTFDTFFESSWYFLRFCSNSKSLMIEENECKYWMPVDHYIGGIEHATGHLLYARFFVKVLKDLEGLACPDEPFVKLSNQGMVLHNTFKDIDGNWVYPDDIIKEGDNLIHKHLKCEVFEGKMEKMSKSKKNVVDIDPMIEKYGADAVRLFVLSDSPPENDMQWSSIGIQGAKRFLNNLYSLSIFIKENSSVFSNQEIGDVEELIEQTIKNVTSYVETAKINNAISALRILYNKIVEKKGTYSISICKAFSQLIIMLNPFIPHITEEIWELLGNTALLAQYPWPKCNTLLNKESNLYSLIVQVNSKIQLKIMVRAGLDEEEIKQQVLSEDKIKSALLGKQIIEVIFIPNKVINFIATNN